MITFNFNIMDVIELLILINKINFPVIHSVLDFKNTCNELKFNNIYIYFIFNILFDITDFVLGA